MGKVGSEVEREEGKEKGVRGLIGIRELGKSWMKSLNKSWPYAAADSIDGCEMP